MIGYSVPLTADFYEFIMAAGYFKTRLHTREVCFDWFFRSVPDGGGFAIAAGLEQFIEYIENLRFESENIAYLESKGLFDRKFLNLLADFKFSGDIYAVPEGTPVFPNEPLLTVKAPAIEAQIIETYTLLSLNHQSLIATKANRMVRAAAGKPVIEFGARRAQGALGAVLGARAAYIGGCAGSSCTSADANFKIGAVGTMAHSWVQMFDSEYEAFAEHCRLYPRNAVLVVDTYDSLNSGIPNAIRVFKEILLPQGITDFAVRLDSGDIAEISKTARSMLDAAGLNGCRIIASNSLDEYRISELVRRGARVDAFGAGERLITAKSDPVFGGVYKLSAAENAAGEMIPKIKVSDNAGKTTVPGRKTVYRLFDSAGTASGDIICAFDEPVSEIDGFEVRELLVPIFKRGERVYDTPPIAEIRAYCDEQIKILPEPIKRLASTQKYSVTISEKLKKIKATALGSA